MRIALCITDLDFGGAELALVELSTRIDRNRFEPVVYCLAPRPLEEETSCVSRLEKADIEVHCLGARRKRDFFRVTSDLRRRLERQRPDLLQSFLFHANLIGRIAARQVGVPQVVSGIRVAERKSRWHLWLDRMTHKRVDRYVCVSESVARFSATVGRLPSEKLVVIPNGIDGSCYPAKPRDLSSFGIDRSDQVVTFVGRLDQQKGVRWLIRASDGWLRQIPNAHLLLVGEGLERKTIERTRPRLKHGNRIHLAGKRADVPEILAASDLLVLPSRWEGMPNVVLQAMASGLPIVATDVEGVRELLGPEADRQIVAFGVDADFVEKVVRFLSNRSQSALLGEKNQARAKKEFSIGRAVTSYEGLWESLIEPEGKAGKNL